MASRKKVEPREKKTTASRQSKTVVPRWNILERPEDGLSITLERSAFMSDGKWNSQALWQARQTYPGVDIRFKDEGSPVIYRQKSLFMDKNGNLLYGRLEHLRSQGFKTAFYEMPHHDPAPTMERERKKAETDALEAARGRRNSTPTVHKAFEVMKGKYPGAHVFQDRELTPRGTWVTKGSPYLINSANQRVPFSPGAAKHMSALAEGKALAAVIHAGEGEGKSKGRGIGRKLRAAEKARAKLASIMKKMTREDALRFRPLMEIDVRKNAAVVKTVSRSLPSTKGRYTDPSRGRGGDRYDPLKHELRPKQYVDSSGKIQNTTAARIASRNMAQERRLERAVNRSVAEAQSRRQKQMLAAERTIAHQKNAEQKTALRARRKKFSKTVERHRNEIKASSFKQRMAQLKNYAHVPLKMLPAYKRSAAPKAVRDTAIAKTSRDIVYPKMRHAAGKVPLAMRRMTGVMKTGVELGRGLGSFGTGRMGGSIRSMTTPLSTNRFPAGGQGVFITIDAAAAIEQLSIGFPAAIRGAILSISDGIGKRLLDIVEPYVPKDTGLLYSTATSSVGLTAGGLVDIEGAEGYPSDMAYGVSISYNAPYAEIVYVDEPHKAHGAEYNRIHNTNVKGPLETAKWIEVAFEKERAAIDGLAGEYATAVSVALSAAGGKRRR